MDGPLSMFPVATGLVNKKLQIWSNNVRTGSVEDKVAPETSVF